MIMNNLFNTSPIEIKQKKTNKGEEIKYISVCVYIYNFEYIYIIVSISDGFRVQL